MITRSEGHSLMLFEQRIKRIQRPGQTRPVTYYHVLAEGTVDRQIRKALATKQDVIRYVLGEHGKTL
jgi:SNF2 family DNA or RNA helicase